MRLIDPISRADVMFEIAVYIIVLICITVVEIGTSLLGLAIMATPVCLVVADIIPDVYIITLPLCMFIAKYLLEYTLLEEVRG